MSVHDAIHDYETRTVKYGFDAVKASLGQQGGDGILHKPVIGRVALGAVPIGQRLVNHLPPLENQFTKSLIGARK